MSLGEILIKALMDTLLGMGTVFAILILICIIISLFKYIPKDEPKKAEAAAKAPIAPEDKDDEEDEIIAAILAAIRMSRELEMAGMSSEEAAMPEYIVKSVKRRR